MREATKKALQQLPLAKLIEFVRKWSYSELQVPCVSRAGFARFNDFPEPASIELITITRQEIMEYLLLRLEQYEQPADKYAAIYAVEAEHKRYDVIGLLAKDGSKEILLNSVSLDYCNGFVSGLATALGLVTYEWDKGKLAGVRKRQPVEKAKPNKKQPPIDFT